MPAYIFDIAIIVILALFAWRGAARGLVLTLCGLAAIFVAYFGAQSLSNTFCEPVAGIIRPVIAQTIKGTLPDAIREVLDNLDEYLPTPTEDPAATGEPEAPEISGEPEASPAPEGSGTEPQAPFYTVEQVMDDIEEAGILKGVFHFLRQAVDEGKIQQGPQQSPVDALADYLAKGFARTILFSLIFLAITLGWFLLSHAMDLAFKLPILAQLNLAGGLIIGLIEAGLIIIVLVWAGQAMGLIPAEPESPLLKLFTADHLWKLWEDLPA